MAATYHDGPGAEKVSIFGAILRLAFKLCVYFLLISIALLFIYRFAPVPVTATMLMDSSGAKRDWVALEDVSPNMIRAVIAAEDSKFCEHDGFDKVAIGLALAEKAAGKRQRGASTISQQAAKNVFLWQGGGFFRKGLEAMFTVAIEQIWGKRRIMEVYLNVAETGIGTYGAQEGAIRYFKKPANKLTRIEAARMAAALPSPKKRGVANASGFTRRYGNAIAARMNIVKRDELDDCVYE